MKDQVDFVLVRIVQMANIFADVGVFNAHVGAFGGGRIEDLDAFLSTVEGSVGGEGGRKEGSDQVGGINRVIREGL